VKDFKPRAQPVKQSNIGNTLVGIFIGLMMGLLICAAIAVYMMKSPFPWSAKPKAPERVLSEPQADAKAPSVAPGAGAGRAVAESKGDAKPDTRSEARTDTAAATPEKPRFEFYKILPGQEGAPPPPSEGNRAAVARPPRSADPTAAVEHFILQAGAFQSPADADGLKARLALIGLEANIEPVDLPDRGTWYRVRLGPYSSVAEVNHVRSQLAQNGVDASLVRNSPGR
jgi:cell division protein FtsN